ncbi:phage N-6-adenine-methyltransferase [Klebsiella pneumoniae]|nr:phage N-6-adenine-methyltransferase [Klebsiella pneumoniae]
MIKSSVTIRDKSLKDLWRTPRWLFSAIQQLLSVRFTVDVACNSENALLPVYIGVERDALSHHWGEPGTVAFLNPPYSRIEPWVDAAIREQCRGVTTVMLVPQSMDTAWYTKSERFANETIVITGGRIAFMEPDTELGEVEVTGNTGGSMLIVFRGRAMDAGHVIRGVPLAVLERLGGYVNTRRRAVKTSAAA